MPSAYRGNTNPTATVLWAALTPHSLGDLVTPSPISGQYFICTAGGTTSSSQPAWSGPQTIGTTFVESSGVTWVCGGSNVGMVSPVVQLPVDTDEPLSANEDIPAMTLADFLAWIIPRVGYLAKNNVWTDGQNITGGTGQPTGLISTGAAGNNDGIHGVATGNGVGVSGVGTTGAGVSAQATSGDAVQAQATTGIAVSGGASGANPAIQGINSGTGDGIDGTASGGGTGVKGSSVGGVGVSGTTGGTSPATQGINTSSGAGVLGSNTGTGVGVFGTSVSAAAAVEGDNSGTGHGVNGTSVSVAAGVAGSNSGTGAGVSGLSTGASGTGVQGGSVNGVGVTGNVANSTAGVLGNNTGSGEGVEGTANSGAGVLGSSTSGPGIEGLSVSGVGVEATGNATRGPLYLVPLSTPPSTPQVGELYVDTFGPPARLWVCLTAGSWTQITVP
jgi:hypothetical protein